MRVVKQSTGVNVAVFMTDAADYSLGKAGLTLTITASKDCAAFGTITPTVTELANGWYKLALTSSHTDTLGDLALHVTGNGAVATDLVLSVRANILGDTLPANLLTWKGSTPSDLQSGRVDSYIGAVAAGVIAAASFAANALDAVWSATTRLLTAGTNIVLAKGTGVTGFNDISAQDVWDKATSALTTSGSIGKRLADDIDAAVSSRSTYAGADTSGTTTLLSRLTGTRATNLDHLDADISSRSSHSAADVGTQITSDHGSGSYARNTEPDNTSIAAIKANTDLIPGVPVATAAAVTGDHGSGSYVRNTEPPTAAAMASQVRTELATELAHLDADVSSRSTYNGSDTAGTTTLLARLSAARALLLDQLNNLDTLVSSRLAAADYTAPDNATIASIFAAVDTEVAAILAAVALIKMKTDLLPAFPAAAGDAMTLTSGERAAIADAHLDRADGIEPGLTPRQASRLQTAALVGKASGMDVNAPVFRNYGDTKTRISADTDEFGNRLSVTTDVN